ncbi:glycosyltransferase family 20-domain-containing protein [Suillus lakei]|nr:glycosyltransferase family 20-domain-containing protein [Suillus lakei]
MIESTSVVETKATPVCETIDGTRRTCRTERLNIIWLFTPISSSTAPSTYTDKNGLTTTPKPETGKPIVMSIMSSLLHAQECDAFWHYERRGRGERRGRMNDEGKRADTPQDHRCLPCHKESLTECWAPTSSASKPTATPATSPPPAFAYAGMKPPAGVLWLHLLAPPVVRALFHVVLVLVWAGAEVQAEKLAGVTTKQPSAHTAHETPAERASRAEANLALGNMWVLMYRGMSLPLHIVWLGWMRRGLRVIRIQLKLEALHALYADKIIIVGRDKLDVVKGILQKLRAFEKLLHDYPECQHKAMLIQVTSPALTNSLKLERQVSELVAHINIEYGSLDFIPVHHYHQTLRKDEFYALLSAADLGVFTPLRDDLDGVRCRSCDEPRVGDVGVGESVNARGVTQVLAKMLLSRINGQNTVRQTPYIPRDRLKELYDNAGKRLFLLDYDATLTPIVKMPSIALPSPDVLATLAKLTSDSNNIVHIRRMDEFHCEFGYGLDGGSGQDFQILYGAHDWESFEMKKSSITWHYRSTDPEWGQFQCRQCQYLLENDVVPKRPIEVLVGKKNLEFRPIAANKTDRSLKGEIAKRILYQNPGVEFIFCAGDDKTDEDMFRALLLFPPSSISKATMEPLLSVTLVDNAKEHSDVELAVSPEAVFTTAIDYSSKRTLASWHVMTPEEVVEHMLYLVGGTPQGEVVKGYL